MKPKPWLEFPPCGHHKFAPCHKRAFAWNPFIRQFRCFEHLSEPLQVRANRERERWSEFIARIAA